MAAKEEAKKHASKVTVVDEIPPPSGSTSTRYCMWNIDSDLKEISDIYFRSCMKDKAHSELVKQFPKPDFPALHVPELDKWLVLIQGKQSLAGLHWEQDLQVTERNYMDAAGPLCILLQHLKYPQVVQVGEAINLVIQSLSLLGHALTTVNKHRHQDIVKSTHITDITELGKLSDCMQKFLFGESKAKELNFVGELAEKVSKAIQPQNKKNSSRKNSGRGNSSSNSHGQNDHSSHSACSFSKNQSSQSFHKKKPYINNQPFWRVPSHGKPYLGGRTKGSLPDRSPTSSPCMLPTGTTYKKNRGKPSFYSFTFPSPFCLHQLRKHCEGREAKAFSPELGTLNIRPVDSLVKDEITRLLDKKAIVSVPHPWNLFYSNLFLVEKKGGGQLPAINLSSLNSFVRHHHFKMEDLKVVADILDLEDAYFAIPIHPEHQKLLCSEFQNVTYQFKCLPFGLTSAPRVLTKLLKPLVAFVRRLGLRICIYIDDLLILNSQREGASQI